MAPAQQKDSGKKVLKNILERETNGNTADPKQFDQITCSERWRNHGKCNQKTQDKNACLDQAREQ
ncbi:MAG TPA: hypothetical protein VF863_08260 [Candidatus Acidoferrum sp.]